MYSCTYIHMYTHITYIHTYIHTHSTYIHTYKCIKFYSQARWVRAKVRLHKERSTLLNSTEFVSTVFLPKN